MIWRFSFISFINILHYQYNADKVYLYFIQAGYSTVCGLS